ncbi:MAG: S1C family serine protease, partial [Eubacterium sp.]
MDDFENKNYSTDSSNGSRPDYYSPNNNSNGTYYTPPQTEQRPPADNTTYHYAYNHSTQQSSQNNSYYQPQDNGYNYSPSPDNNDDSKPPKKSNAAKVIIIVLVVCLIVAAVGLVVAAVGKGTAQKTDETQTASQSQSVEDAAETKESGAVPLTDKDNNYTVAGVADKVMDSCVGITVYSQQTDAYNYFYGYGQGGSSSSEPSKSGEGSGVLMSEQNGKTYVLTCAHVISGGDSFAITLNDGTELEAKMVGYDSQTDIGVLSVDKTGLQIAEFANSDGLVVGEQVVAIGCPGGLEFMNSVTSGYISALARPISSSIGYDNECIQIDAAINP